MGRGHLIRPEEARGRFFNFLARLKKREREQVSEDTDGYGYVYGMYYAVDTRPCIVAVYSSNSSIVPCLS